MPLDNEKPIVEELIKYTKDNETAITLADGKIIAFGVVYKNEEDLKRKIKFAKKYFSLTDTIKNLFSFSRSKKP
jgi:hypothetical protein